MKKLLLAFLFIATLSKANHYVIVDSISPKAPCLFQSVKIYCHDSTGGWSGTEQLVLKNSSFTVHTGTHQALVDSNYVWTFTFQGGSYVGFDSPYGWNVIAIPAYTCVAAIENYTKPRDKDDYFYYNMGIFQMRINLRTKEKEVLLD
ncbi:MAG TPA: hypothetical protein VN698_04825 [Bacteroidia bacterium]|nr:hypothetical protein [Bacteroidia bacterium]